MEDRPKSLADMMRVRKKTVMVRDSISNDVFRVREIVMDNPGTYLKQSGRCRAAALGLTTASASFALVGCLLEDKIDDDGELKLRHDARKACFITSGACDAVALICEICAIDFKIKAGRSLEILTGGNRVGLRMSL